MSGVERIRAAAVRFESRGYPGRRGPRGIVFQVPTALSAGMPDWVDAAWLIAGATAIRSVGRVVVGGPFSTVLRTGTGFLVADDLVLTNHHVLPDPGDAGAARLELEFRTGLDGSAPTPVVTSLDPSKCFVAHPELDYALVGLASIAGVPAIEGGNEAAVATGTPLVVIQHPNGGPQRVSVRNGHAFGPVTDIVHYTADTDEGSSGAPVMDDRWRLVALHRAGVPRRDNEGRILDLEDNPWEPSSGRDQIRFVANEGVAWSAVRQDLSARARRLPRRTRERVRALVSP